MTTKARFEFGHWEYVFGVSWWIQQPCLVGIILEKVFSKSHDKIGCASRIEDYCRDLQSISRDMSKLFWGMVMGKCGEDPAERNWIFSTICVGKAVWWELWDAKLPITSENSRFSHTDHTGRTARDLTIVRVWWYRMPFMVIWGCERLATHTYICSLVWAILRQIYFAELQIYVDTWCMYVWL